MSDSFASLFEQSSRTARERKRIAVGEQLEVTVVKIGSDAVFVDLDGKEEGFIELASLEGEDGSPIVQVGSRLTARIVEVGGKQGAARLEPIRIRGDRGGDTALATESGPVLTVGMKVKGAISGIERYGVFVKLGPRQRGLVPVQELGVPRGADLKKSFAVGQEIESKIIAIDETGKIRLSVTALATDAEREQFESFGKPEGSKPGDKKPAPKAPVRFGTLGDLLGGVKVAAAPAKPAPGKPAAAPGKPAARRR